MRKLTSSVIGIVADHVRANKRIPATYKALGRFLHEAQREKWHECRAVFQSSRPPQRSASVLAMEERVGSLAKSWLGETVSRDPRTSGNRYAFCLSDGGTLGTRAGADRNCALEFRLDQRRVPDAGLIIDKQGNLYGTTYEGDANSEGTLFKITP